MPVLIIPEKCEMDLFERDDYYEPQIAKCRELKSRAARAAVGATPSDQDPTFHYRRKIANFCETACRLFNDIENLPDNAELTEVRTLLDTTGRKLRAAVMAATEPT